MDLVRDILLKVEAAPFNGGPLSMPTFPDHDNDEVTYHVMLLHDAGLIHAFDLSGDEFAKWHPAYLTWAGHEFLEAAKDNTRWNRAKGHFKDKGAPMVFDVLKTLLVSYAKQAVFGPADS
jgi:hypothetical protein